MPRMSVSQGSDSEIWSIGWWLWSNVVSFWDDPVATLKRLCQLTVTVTTTGIAATATLADICTPDHVRQALPHKVSLGITLDPSSVLTNLVTNAYFPASQDHVAGTADYCNVTFAYSHNDHIDDRVNVQYWVPAPASFQNRYLSTGGVGFMINALDKSLPLGLLHGAVSGQTDGGFGGFSRRFDEVIVSANGVLNEQALKMYAYQAIYELTTIGKQFTQQLFKTFDSKLYAYYEGCSEGGRDGWSQIQRYESEFDGLITGAPALRFSHQQIQHLWSNVVEKMNGYYPPMCEMDAITKEIIAACDPLDGKVDGVISRSDLCKIHLDITSATGKPYYCLAQTRDVTVTTEVHLDFPVQNGTVTSEAVALAREILDGARNAAGERLYFSYQPGASFMDAITKFSNSTQSYEMHVNGLGGMFVSRLLMFRNVSTLENLNGITYDTLQDWMIQGWETYNDTLQTGNPDLRPFHEAGGKVLQYHGEADESVPTASSVRYWESVRRLMYPNMTYNDSAAALNNWYRLYLIPGAAHCKWNPNFQVNGPWPQTKLSVLIDWVEKGIVPVTLNATHIGGASLGQNARICSWPLRPLWTENGTQMNCVYDQQSIDSWQYELDAFDVPVY